MSLTRRELLGRGAVLGAGLMLPLRWGAGGARAATALAGASLARFVDPLPIPPFLPASWLAANGLTMAEATHRFHRDLGETPTWGYAGASYLGPTFETRRGKPVTFEARNRLGPHLLGIDQELHGPTPEDVDAPRVSVHLHGGYTEEHSDGYPEATFRPGESWTYTYANEQQAGIRREGAAGKIDHEFGLESEAKLAITLCSHRTSCVGVPSGPRHRESTTTFSRAMAFLRTHS